VNDLLRGIFARYAIADGLQNDTYPPVQGIQMGFPKNGGHRVPRHALPHSGAQSRRSVVEAAKRRGGEILSGKRRGRRRIDKDKKEIPSLKISHANLDQTWTFGRFGGKKPTHRRSTNSTKTGTLNAYQRGISIFDDNYRLAISCQGKQKNIRHTRERQPLGIYAPIYTLRAMATERTIGGGAGRQKGRSIPSFLLDPEKKESPPR